MSFAGSIIVPRDATAALGGPSGTFASFATAFGSGVVENFGAGRSASTIGTVFGSGFGSTFAMGVGSTFASGALISGGFTSIGFVSAIFVSGSVTSSFFGSIGIGAGRISSLPAPTFGDSALAYRCDLGPVGDGGAVTS